MATLPRAHSSKIGTNLISSPFSTSPRKLQDVSSAVPEAHDVTTASCISIKQYEEQLNALKKENFHLKLRVYFIQERLNDEIPLAMQGLLEHNVRLHIEVEELRRQLSDKQELLAAAAEAIDVLEQQGSIASDSINNSTNQNEVEPAKQDDITCEKKDLNNEENANSTCPESESAADYLAVTVNNDDIDELVKLKKENQKALQMIQVCMKKIQQQNKAIKKLKLDKELQYAQVSDTHLEKYAEILKCKDEHIKDLESKIREFQKNAENAESGDSSGNLQQLLTRRLQGLAFFLDKLLSHKCVLGEDKKKLAESILEQSLALPVGLKLDETMAHGDFTMDESNIDISQSLRMEDLTMMFGHHMSCGEINNRQSLRRSPRRLQQIDMSESEAWSEPDRNVSLARIGLCEMSIGPTDINNSSDNNRQKTRKSRVSHGSRSDDNKTLPNNTLHDELNQLMEQYETMQEEKNDILDKLTNAEQQITELTNDKETLQKTLATETNCLIEANNQIAMMKTKISSLETSVMNMEQQLADTFKIMESLRLERQELELVYVETERNLRRAADEATLQASQAALDRAKAQHDKMRIEKELEETREKLAHLLEANAQLEIEVTKKAAFEGDQANNMMIVRQHIHSDDDRPPSPDQGIDSDRLSSLEQNDAVPLSPRSLYEENVTLKHKLARTKATLAETLAQLNAANTRKINVQRAICREIHKTHGVLRKARDHLENQNQ